jgi:hypothetical protein
MKRKQPLGSDPPQSLRRKASAKESGAKKRPCCFVAEANPSKKPAHHRRPLTAKQKLASTKATKRGSVKAVEAKRMLKGEKAMIAADAKATPSP